MRLLLQSTIVVAVLMLLLFAAPSANAAACASNANGNWGTAGTWSNCGGGIPTAADTVEISRDNTVTVNVSNAVAASVLVGRGANSNAGTLVFSSGSQLTVSGIVTLGGSGDPGTITMTSGGTLNARGLALGSSGGTWTPGTGTVVLTATNTLPTTIFTTFNNLTTTTGTTTLGVNTAVNGTLTQSGGDIAVGTRTLTVNGTHDANTNIVSEAGGYTLASGATLLSGHTSGVNGNITTTTRTLNTAANYTFDGTSAQVTGTAMPATVNNLTINNAAGVTLSQDTATSGNLAVTAGTFTVGAFNYSVTGTTTVSGALSITSTTGAKTFTGNVTINNGGTWNETVSEAISFGGNLQNDGTLTDGGGTHTFTGATKTFSGANAISIANVAVTGTYTNNGTLTVGTALSGAGSLTQGADDTLNLGGTSPITTLAATATGNTVNFNGAAQTVNNNNYYHLNLSGSGAKTLQTSTTAISGNLTLSGTASATTVVGLAIGGNLNVPSGTTYTIAGFDHTVTGTTSVSGTLTHDSTAGTKTHTGNVTINNGGTWNETANTAISFGGSLQNDGTFTAGAGIHTFTGTAKTISGVNAIVIPSLTISGTTTNTGTLTVSTTLAGASTLTNGANATLNFGGSSITPTLTASASGNTVVYTLAGAQTVRGTTYHNLTLAGSGSKTTTSVTVNGTLSMQGTATATAAPTYGATATLEYKGSAAQTSGPELLATMAAGRTVIINNAAGVTLGGNTTVNGTLTFTTGNVTTGANTLYIGSGGTVSRASGHVVGNFKKFIATGATSTTFEVGDATNYTPALVSFASVTTAGDLTVSVVSGDHANIGTSTINAAKSVNRNWTLTNSGLVFGTYGATFTFVAGDVDGSANTSSFIVGKYSGGSWAYPTVGTKTATTTETTGLTTFGDFQLGEAASSPPSVPLVKSVTPSGTQEPGTDLVYTVVFTNDGGQGAQLFVVIDPRPDNTDFKLGSASAALGTTGMTVAIAYSNDGGATYTYPPVSTGGGAPAGYDRLVTHIRWTFTGNLSQTSPNNAGSIGFSVRIR